MRPVFPDYLPVSYDYCILRNILQNKICHFYSLDQIKRDQVTISKTCPKEILNINNLVTPFNKRILFWTIFQLRNSSRTFK